MAVVLSSSYKDPPSANTFPLGKITASISIRGWLIVGPYCHAGVAAPRSMISVVAVAGFPPPLMITLGS